MTPFLDHDGLVLYQGDCLDILAELADSSVDAVVTDPPYGINFMGKAWDGRAIEEAAQRGRDTRQEMPPRLTGDPDHPERRKLTARTGSAFANRAGEAGAYDFSLTGNRAFQQWVEQWGRELLRVLKPGGHALVFGGTRTYHRLAAGIEDAGFEIRDCLAWMYGSGFPKSLDVAKAIDKLGGDPEILEEMAMALREARERRGLTLAQADEIFCDGSSAWPWYEGRVWYGERKVVPPGEARAAAIAEEWPDTAEVFAKMKLRGAFAGTRTHRRGGGHKDFGKVVGSVGVPREVEEYALATDGAREWQGWGTALKPAFEPIVVARKPLVGTVAANVLEYGTGAINVDGCRVGTIKDVPASVSRTAGLALSGSVDGSLRRETGAESGHDPNVGRWPANLVLGHADGCVLVGSREIRGDGNWSGATESVGYEGGWDTSNHPRDRRVPAVEQVEVWECVDDCPVYRLDEQTGTLPGGVRMSPRTESRMPGWGFGESERPTYGDAGGASRFFYCAKVSRAERSAGIPEGLKNDHPTVKPIDLMRWLVRLVTPPEGVVLDPFLGSGTTGCAAALEGFSFVGIDQDEHYLRDIAQHRVAFWREHGEDGLRICAELDAAARERRDREDAGQLALEMP